MSILTPIQFFLCCRYWYSRRSGLNLLLDEALVIIKVWIPNIVGFQCIWSNFWWLVILPGECTVLLYIISYIYSLFYIFSLLHYYYLNNFRSDELWFNTRPLYLLLVAFSPWSTFSAYFFKMISLCVMHFVSLPVCLHTCVCRLERNHVGKNFAFFPDEKNGHVYEALAFKPKVTIIGNTIFFSLEKKLLLLVV